jgi:integrase
MSRPSKGTVTWRRDIETGRPCWHARYTRGDRTRTNWVPLDPDIPEDDVEGAQACAATLAPKAKATTKDGRGETVASYAARWCSWRATRGLACVEGDRAILASRILPHVGRLDVRKVARDDLKRLVSKLDRAVSAGEFAGKTAVNAWIVCRALFRDAQKAKDVALCVRDDNPADGVAGPDTGAKKAKVYLWPSEFAQLVGCPAVPVRWRRLYAIAVYTYMRAGELAALEPGDVDLDHATILVRRSLDSRRGKGVKATNSEAARRIPIEPELMPLLRALKAKAEGTRLLRLPGDGLSERLRHHLKLAGVTRSDLFQSDATRKAMTFHDLRATGITWAAARGDEPLRIKQRAGHASFSTTEIYLREAENLMAGFGTPFPPLPKAIVTGSSVTFEKSPKALKKRLSKWPLRGSNPDALAGGGF